MTGPILPLAQVLQAVASNYFASVLDATGGNVTQAAKISGMTRQNFYRRARACGLELDRERPTARAARGGRVRRSHDADCPVALLAAKGEPYTMADCACKA